MEPLLDWARALGFPAWAIIILIAWMQLRSELRAMSKEWRLYRMDMERRVTWLEATGSGPPSKTQTPHKGGSSGD